MLVKTRAIVLVLLVGGCATVTDIVDPPNSPKPGDIQNSLEFRSRLQALITNGAIDPEARSVRLANGQLADWKKRSVSITTDTYEGKGKAGRGKFGLPAGLPEDVFGIHCNHQLDRPFVYLNYQLKGDYLGKPQGRSYFLEGNCTELQGDKKRLMVGLYSFEAPFSAMVLPTERMRRIETTLGWREYPLRQTDQHISEFQTMLIGEAASFVYEDVPGLIPHSSSERKRGNYYRLVLIGTRTMLSLDVYGPRTASISDLQAIMWPVLQVISTYKSQ